MAMGSELSLLQGMLVLMVINGRGQEQGREIPGKRHGKHGGNVSAHAPREAMRNKRDVLGPRKHILRALGGVPVWKVNRGLKRQACEGHSPEINECA